VPPEVPGQRTTKVMTPADPGLPVATGGVFTEPEGAGEGEGTCATDASASALLASPLDSARARGAAMLPPLMAGSASNGLMMPFPNDQPPQLPPPSNRIVTNVPPTVYGTVRDGKVAAPTVSVNPAQANPNLMNLLLEVPYKRGVHTVSVNQRYLNHEPTFDAAFELMPARADFGPLMAGAVYRHALKLVNVSNLSQRYSIKQNARAKVIHSPGVVAAGMSVLLEVEVRGGSLRVARGHHHRHGARGDLYPGLRHHPRGGPPRCWPRSAAPWRASPLVCGTRTFPW